jgi:5-methyltetrahydrofolate--homocysteine methyltransferase
MNDPIAKMKDRVLLYDGAKQIMLQRAGLPQDEPCELWNASHPEEVRAVYRAYREAGSDVLQTNTFPGNRSTLAKYGLGGRSYELCYEGTRLAREVAGNDLFVAGAIGPTGLIFEPAGELTFAQAYDVYRELARAIRDGGGDCIHLETFADLTELKAAILAVRENTELPVWASTTYGAGDKTLSGNPPEVCGVVCGALGAQVIGANCSTGPRELLGVVERMASVVKVPLMVKANAGLPRVVEGKVVFEQSPEAFGSYTKPFVERGVRLIGGCCGTTPEFVREIKKQLDELGELPEFKGESACIASAYRSIPISGLEGDRVMRLRRGAELPDSLFRRGSYQEMIEKIVDVSRDDFDALFIDFGDETVEWDISAFVASFSLFVKQPVLIRAHPSMLEPFLRFYPGRPGVVGADGAGEEIIRKYSAPDLTHLNR